MHMGHIGGGGKEEARHHRSTRPDTTDLRVQTPQIYASRPQAKTPGAHTQRRESCRAATVSHRHDTDMLLRHHSAVFYRNHRVQGNIHEARAHLR
jgi:hypothetical protein